LLFNPVSGAHLEYREATMHRIAEVFRRAGVEVLVEATQARGSAGSQARAAISAASLRVSGCTKDGSQALHPSPASIATTVRWTGVNVTCGCAAGVTAGGCAAGSG